MLNKILAVSSVVGLFISAGWADTMRPSFTMENRFLEQMSVEAGAIGQYYSYEDDLEHFQVDHNEFWGVPYARLGLFDNLSTSLKVPFGNVDDKNADGGTGFGDMELGLQFLAYEDIFHYPFIIPHAEARFKTGDEKKGLGDGDNSLNCGVSVGSVMYDNVTLIVDGSYKFIQNVNRNYRVAGSVIWDLNEEFALLAEGYVASEKREDWDDERTPIFGQAGMSYKASEQLEFTAMGGGGRDGAPTVSATVKAAYSF